MTNQTKDKAIGVNIANHWTNAILLVLALKQLLGRVRHLLCTFVKMGSAAMIIKLSSPVDMPQRRLSVRVTQLAHVTDSCSSSIH